VCLKFSQGTWTTFRSRGTGWSTGQTRISWEQQYLLVKKWQQLGYNGILQATAQPLLHWAADPSLLRAVRLACKKATRIGAAARTCRRTDVSPRHGLKKLNTSFYQYHIMKNYNSTKSKITVVSDSIHRHCYNLTQLTELMELTVAPFFL